MIEKLLSSKQHYLITNVINTSFSQQGPICRGRGWGFNPPNDFFLTARVSVDLSAWGGSIITPVLVLHVSACGASNLLPDGDPPPMFFHKSVTDSQDQIRFFLALWHWHIYLFIYLLLNATQRESLSPSGPKNLSQWVTIFSH